MNNENMNIAQLARELDWLAKGKEYQHLLILLNYMPLNQAIRLVLAKENNT